MQPEGASSLLVLSFRKSNFTSHPDGISPGIAPHVKPDTLTPVHRGPSPVGSPQRIGIIFEGLNLREPAALIQVMIKHFPPQIEGFRMLGALALSDGEFQGAVWYFSPVVFVFLVWIFFSSPLRVFLTHWEPVVYSQALRYPVSIPTRGCS